MAEGRENPADALRSLLRDYAKNNGSGLEEDRLKGLLGVVSSEEKLEILSQNLNSDGQTALQIAAMSQTNTVRLILNSIEEQNDRISLITARNHNGMNTIFYAAITDRLNSLRLLLSYIPEERRSEETAKTEGSMNIYTVMHQVVEENQSGTLQFLLETLSDRLADILNHRYGSAMNNLLEIAAKKNDSSIACTLLQSYQEDQRLEALICLDSTGNAAIHWLAEKSQSGFRRQSLAPITCSDIATVKNVDQQTALHLAAAKNHHEFLLELLDGVPKEQQYDLQGNKDEQGRTLVHHGAGKLEELGTVVSLVPEEKRFDLLSAADNNGQTALHKAAKRNHVAHLEFILKGHTPDQRLTLLNFKDDSNKTAEDVAESNGCIEARDFLRQKKETIADERLEDLEENVNGNSAELERSAKNQNERLENLERRVNAHSEELRRLAENQTHNEEAGNEDSNDQSSETPTEQETTSQAHNEEAGNETPTEQDQLAQRLETKIQELENEHVRYEAYQKQLDEEISQLELFKDRIQTNIEEITSQQERDKREHDDVKNRLDDIDKLLSSPNKNTSSDYCNWCLEKEKLVQQERKCTQKKLSDEEKIAECREDVKRLESDLEEFRNQRKSLQADSKRSKETLWTERAKLKKTRKAQGNEVLTVEEELAKFLSKYDKAKGVIRVPNEFIEEILHTIKPKEKYDIICDVGSVNNSTVFHFAALHGHKTLLNHLLKKLRTKYIHKLFRTQNEASETVFHCAAKKSHNGVLEMLLKKTKGRVRHKLLGLPNNKSATVMLAGIKKYDSYLNAIRTIRRFQSSKKWVRLLADSTADDSTVLHLAAACGHEDLVRFILSHPETEQLVRLLKRADMSGLLPVFRSLNVSTARELLKPFSEEQRMEIVSCSISSGYPAFHCWLKTDCFDQPNPDILRAFGEILNPTQWVDLNAMQSSNGYTALHWAADGGHSEIARVIVEKTQADERLSLLKKVDDSGDTALIKAAIAKNGSVIVALLDKLHRPQRLALLSHSYDHGRTIVHILVQEQRPISTLVAIFRLLDSADILELLSQQEADKFTPIHLAAAARYMETVKFLSSYLPSNAISTFNVLKCVNNENETVLHCVAKKGETQVYDLLLRKLSWVQRRELLRMRNCDGQTAEMLMNGKSYSCERGNPTSKLCAIQ